MRALDVHVYSLYSIYCNHINTPLFLWASCMRHGNSFVLEHSLCIFCFNRILSHMAVNSTERISLGEFICKTYPLCLPCAMMAYWTRWTSDSLVSGSQGEEFLTFPSETGDLPDFYGASFLNFTIDIDRIIFSGVSLIIVILLQCKFFSRQKLTPIS